MTAMFRPFSVALGMAMLALAACSASAQQAKAPPPLTVTTTVVRRMPIATYASLDGQVDPFLQSNIATEQGGTILKIYANEGDRVTQGQALAQIDDAPLRATLAQQQGERGAASAKLSEAQTQVPITNTLYATALTQAQQTLSQAQYQQVADRANVANTKATYQADAQLEAQGYVAHTAFEQASAAYVAAQQLLAADTAKITQARAAVDEAQRNLLNSRVQAQVVEENRGTLRQAEGTVQLTQTQIGETTLDAPFSGVVTARLLDPGAYAGPNQAIYQISQINPTYVDFNLKDVDLAYVREGTPLSFTTPAHPGRRYTGSVATINAVPTAGTLLYRARIVMRNPDLSLRGGMLVNVRITKEQHPDALVLPRDAVTQDDGKGEIFSVSDGHAHRVRVSTGLETTTFVEIRSPDVHPGMTVVATRPDQLQDGSAVTIAP